ncbi:hypothetical protein AGMMS49992_05620 [Clostridia bacterium]|nr:hypothetical protein AGMMS49992_05620 [Clostridia bacterium]
MNPKALEEIFKRATLEQKLIVSYSPKYKAYQREVRAGQTDRAQRLVNNPSQLNRKKASDPRWFVEQTHITPNRQVAKGKKARLSQEVIDKEARFAQCIWLKDRPAYHHEKKMALIQKQSKDDRDCRRRGQ